MQAAVALNVPVSAQAALPQAAKRASASVTRVPTTCSGCGLHGLCLPCGLSARDLDQVDELVYARRKIKRGQHLYFANDPFTSLYAVRSGSMKLKLMLEDGREQVMGFVMPGEIMGMEGIASDHQTCDAVALEDSEVCAIPYARLQELSNTVPGVQRWLHKAMSSAIVRDQSVMMLLGTMRAEERLAVFLLNMSQRFAARGFSPCEFNLRATREEIGSFLGLKLETVSRLFSRFQESNLIEVQVKHIRILDLAGLKATLGEVAPAH